MLIQRKAARGAPYAQPQIDSTKAFLNAGKGMILALMPA